MRKSALPVAFLLVGLPVGIGAVMAMGHHDETAAGDSAFTAVAQGAPHIVRRAQARWERVTTITGEGPADRSVAIAPRAIQWRAAWTCWSGGFRMTIGGRSQTEKSVSTRMCPGGGMTTSTTTPGGQVRLRPQTPGRWQVVLSQQVDTALQEPRLADMVPSALVSRGRFHSIQNKAEGTVSLYRLGTGRLALRFEDFYTSASPGLRLWLGRARNVDSTLQARKSGHADAGALRSTLGSFNQMLPVGISVDTAHSIVIWCPTVLIAFGAAPLPAGGSS